MQLTIADERRAAKSRLVAAQAGCERDTNPTDDDPLASFGKDQTDCGSIAAIDIPCQYCGVACYTRPCATRRARRAVRHRQRAQAT